MAPRKPQSWAKVRAAGIAANKVKNASATPQSAWTALIHQNNEHAGNLRALINRKEEEALFGDDDEEEDAGDDVEGEKKKKGKKATEKSKPKPQKITKSTKPKKGQTSKPARTTRSSKRKPIIEDDACEPEIEFWRPYGGETSKDPGATSCLGLARLSTWQYPKFEEAMKGLLDVYAAGAELETEEWKHGGESVTDVLARFNSEEQATLIKDQIEGEMVNGRKVQVRFVDDA